MGTAFDGALVAVCAFVVVVMVTIVFGVVGFGATIAAQALAPWIGAAAPVALACAVLRRRRAVAVFALVASLLYIAVLAPLAVGDAIPAWADDAPTFTVFSANVNYLNDRRDDVAAAVVAADADVVVLHEMTPSQRAALTAAGVDEMYPHRLHSADAEHFGEMVLSRLDSVDLGEEWIDPFAAPAVTVTVADTPIRIYSVHLRAPHQPHELDPWVTQFDILGELATEADTEVVFAGDFNATPFHPPFRNLLDAGLTDAHQATGSGLSSSWAPLAVPEVLAGRLMRLDHSVSTSGVVPLEVVDSDVPGSDHRSLLVTYTVRS